MSYITWGEVARSASNAGAKYPELVAAQWALESAWGTALSGKNNPFGIKGKGTKAKTTEFVLGRQIEVVDEFMDFASIDDAVKYIVDRWYKDFKDYKGVNNAQSRNDAARMLVKDGYATDPKYADKLIALMDRNSAAAVKPAVPSQSISLRDAARWYAGHPHQNMAWDKLQEVIPADVLVQFALNYRSTKPGSAAISSQKFPLNVPYFYQRDSKTGHGERSCQSSALAMVIKYLNPSLITDDDDYLNLVFRYGDTVAQSAHQKALDHLGLKNKFATNGTEGEIIRILDTGCPVPVGILHKGSIQSPSGGGHWITVIGYDKEFFYVHDPFGELDLINGGYPASGPTDGKQQRYTRKNLLKRWLIASTSDGWYWDLSENKRQ